jgi:hypothetical protein
MMAGILKKAAIRFAENRMAGRCFGRRIVMTACIFQMWLNLPGITGLSAALNFVRVQPAFSAHLWIQPESRFIERTEASIVAVST